MNFNQHFRFKFLTSFTSDINSEDTNLAIDIIIKALILFNRIIDTSSIGYGHNRVKILKKDYTST